MPVERVWKKRNSSGFYMKYESIYETIRRFALQLIFSS
jgi:hypothetical protein